MIDFAVIDIEADGLLEEEINGPEATKIYCMSVYQYINDVGLSFTASTYNDMRGFLSSYKGIIVGHKAKTYDIPMLEKHLGIAIDNPVWDTLGLSWYLFPKRYEHGLEYWGEDLGVEKPSVLDWKNLDLNVYIHRCEQDVKINTRVFRLQWEYLLEIYKTEQAARRLIGYLMFKLDCAREQEEVKVKLDVEVTKKNLAFLKAEQERRINVLSTVMPKNIKYKQVARPKSLTKKDGSVSVAGEKWYKLLSELGLPNYHLGTIEVVDKVEPGNPNSHAQLKKWLFELGWVPDYYKPSKVKGSTELKMVPQISNQEGDDVSYSVKELYDKVPELEHISGYFVINHRISILEGFLEHVDKNGFIKSTIGGFTNTLRFQHRKPIVNLPQIPRAYWKEIRECFIAPEEGYILCGSDMSSLEDNTKRHYIWYYDPEYVKEQMIPGFDPHLDIAVLSGALTIDQIEFYKKFDKDKASIQEKEDYSKIKGQRLKSKKVNFAAVYGAGVEKLSLTASISKKEAAILHKTYWKRNHAVKKIADALIIKTIRNQMWLLNPVSQLWYSLKVEKDKFSTLNQGTGVYAFDTWVRHSRKAGIKIAMQYHDEKMFPLPKEDQELVREVLTDAIKQTNAQLQLNVELGISIAFGDNYADIH